jgi:hypothetical protein
MTITTWIALYFVGAVVCGLIIAKGRGPGAGLAVPILASIVWPLTVAIDCLTAAVDVADHKAYQRRQRWAREAREARKREGEE